MKLPVCGIALVLVQLLWNPAGAAAPSAEQGAVAERELRAQLVALERRRADAIVQRNMPALRELMDRYYRHVESRGRVRSKTELLTALERGEFVFETYENESAEVQVLPGGRAAVVAGVFRSQQKGGKLFRGRYVHVWVHEPDGWKNTFHQGTEIRPAADSASVRQ